MKLKTLAIGAAVVIAGVLFAIAWHNTSLTSNAHTKINVVAGEHFWGSLVSQIGGSHISLTTVISDPNADPHEQSASSTNARAFAVADYVVLNGAGYDSWGDKLLASGGPSDRRVLTVAKLLGKKQGDNPHFWYNPAYVNRVVMQIAADLTSIAPKQGPYFKANTQKLQAQLAVYQQQITDIAARYAGTPVAATEDIFTYLATAAHLNLISPASFTEAVAEGNDPPAKSVTEFQNQITSGSAKVLVYNKQTVTPLTTNMQHLAAANHIPVVAISETIQPPNAPFQTWMGTQVANLKAALEHAKQ